VGVGKVKRYILFGQTEEKQELWLMIDAESEEHAREIAIRDSDLIKIEGFGEVTPNEEAGISHKFVVID
jgi:hypothetical protein